MGSPLSHTGNDLGLDFFVRWWMFKAALFSDCGFCEWEFWWVWAFFCFSAGGDFLGGFLLLLRSSLSAGVCVRGFGVL